MRITVEVLGVDLEIEFDGTPFIPARIYGHPDDAMPAEGGEATINAVYLDGTEVTELLSDWVLNKINEQLVEYLCASSAEEDFEIPEFA